MIEELLRRRTLIEEKPYDAKIELLESNGTQFIETGIIPDADTGIYVNAKRIASNDTYIVGLRNNSSSTRWCIGNSPYYGYGGYGGSQYFNVNTIFTAQLNFLNDKKWTVNGVVKANLPSLNFTPLYNIRLFGSAGVVASYSKATIVIYGVKISQGADVIMDLIPVRVGTTGYMYDKVSSQLFGNDGTGDFILGNDI